MVSRVPFQLSGRYAERNRWEVLNGPGDSRVTGSQIIEDEGLVDQWSDKVVLITGVSSGIGVETVMKTPEGRTKDGFELQFGTNHLSHFLLFYLLKDTLLKSSTPKFHSRVVNVSSAGHRYSPIHLDNVNFEGNYNGWLAYGSSKTANIYMATQIERLYGAQGLHGYSLHPGAFMSPNLQKHSQEEMKAVMQNKRALAYLSSLEQSCATTIYASVSSELEGKGGLYLEGASVAAYPTPSGGDGLEYGYSSWAFDEAKEKELWELSKSWVGVDLML
ncbi:hypothetical protein N7519_000509 [Penicillium mononematosum]|uniref:uncharacterized protein n=1 Tax=Penicillium mononematosum TaxID=268346 RepID=UPI0025473842|nr:uncharacterized protein N7519_000509 [Penicillium mononematosum]KAJ6190488.1 hypothetical protein N7519_000509 [Penicillium mononematosum]